MITDYALRKKSPIVLQNKPDNIPENESEHFKNDFFSKVDVMVTVGGSWDSRRHIGDQSIRHSKLLLDAGAENFLGHIQVINDETFVISFCKSTQNFLSP